MDANKKPKKILIIRFGAIGDVVHSSIIQQSIKAKHPDAVIDFMTSDYIEPIIRRDKNLSNTYAFDMKKKNNPFYLLKLGFKLRREKYDVVINLQNSFRNQFLGIMSGGTYIPRLSVGAVHASDAFFNSAMAAYNDISRPEEIKLFLDEEKLSETAQKYKDLPRPFIMISPAGENDKFRKGRIWRFEKWNELVQLLKERFGGTVFVIGSKSEATLHNEFINTENAQILSGQLSLDESIHFFSLADLFVSGDSGPLHMAAAVGVKTVGLYGSTSSTFCAPYGKNGNTIKTDYECKSCSVKTCPYISVSEKYTPCMDAILPQNVLNFIIEKGLL